MIFSQFLENDQFNQNIIFYFSLHNHTNEIQNPSKVAPFKIRSRIKLFLTAISTNIVLTNTTKYFFINHFGQTMANFNHPLTTILNFFMLTEKIITPSLLSPHILLFYFMKFHKIKVLSKWLGYSNNFSLVTLDKSFLLKVGICTNHIYKQQEEVILGSSNLVLFAALNNV